MAFELPKLPRTHASPPAPLSGNRSQAMQRLQVGLFGLAAMVMLVGLASIITTNAEQNEAAVVPAAVTSGGAPVAAAPASDPLADAGVVPDMPAAELAPVSADGAPAR